MGYHSRNMTVTPYDESGVRVMYTLMYYVSSMNIADVNLGIIWSSHIFHNLLRTVIRICLLHRHPNPRYPSRKAAGGKGEKTRGRKRRMKSREMRRKKGKERGKKNREGN